MVRPAHIGVLIFLMGFATPRTASAATNEVLTNAVDVLSLSRAQAARNTPILITGVVTLAIPSWGGLFFVQDSTAGVFVNNSGAPPVPGDVVQVSGISLAGGYAPGIMSPKWKKLGTALLPEARRISGERLASGAEDGQRVEVSGIVRWARPADKTNLQLEVAAGDYHFHAFAPMGSNVDANSLVGAMVRVRGTAAALFNQTNHHLVSVSLWVPREDDFIIDQLPGAAISQAPFTPLGGIARYRRQSPTEERVRVKGIVTYQRPGEDIFLQEKSDGLSKSDGLQVSYRETNVFAPGEIVEAIGFPGIERSIPVLQDAVLKRTGEHEETMVDRSATLPGIFKGFNHANLIALKGKLLDRSVRPLGTTRSSSSALGEHVLTLQFSNFLFSVTAPATPQFAGLSSIPIGSTLEVSGICLLQANHAGAVEAVQLLLPDSTSVRILQRPSWWTAQRLLAGIGILLAVSLVGISWTMTTLRKNFTLKASIVAQEELTLQLRRREACLSEAQRLSHTGSFGWNVVTGEQTWSEENYRILGYDRSIKPMFEMVRDRVHPDDLEVWEEAFVRASEGKQIDFEHRLLMPDGPVKHLRVVAYGVQKDGKFVELVGTARDITESKRAEEAIRRSEAYLAETQKLSHTASWAWNPVSSALLYWSEECYRIHGMDPAHGVPSFESALERIHPEDRPSLLETVDKAVREKAEFQKEYRLLLTGGIMRNLRILAHPVLNASGELIEYLGTVIDVTEQKRAEEERNEHLWLLECMDRINRAMQRTNNMEGLMSGVLKETLAIFDSDRAWLVYPCDPESGTCRVVMEHTRPEYPGAFAPGDEFPVDSHGTELLRRVLDAPGVAVVLSVPMEIRERFSIQSMIAIVVRPKRDRPYLFGLHQCSHARVWTAAERRLFEEIARRLEAALTSVLAHRNLLASEEELRASERKYRNLVDTTPALVHTGLPNGDLDFFNRGWLEYLGLPMTDLLGWRWTAAIHPEDVEELLNKWRASLESGQPFVAESRVRRADGEYRWFLHRKQPQRNEAGEIVKWYGSSIEIEERKIAEEAIRRGEAFLAEGQTLSHTGSWGWNASTRKVMWSQEHFRILGLDPQDTTPSLDVFWERVHPDDRTALQRTFESAIRDKRNFEQEFRIVTPDWSIRHLHGVGHAVLNKANELVEFIGSTMDITERKRAEERAQSHNVAVRLALNAFVKELDVDRFLEHMIKGLTKQFEATSAELWLFDGTTQLASLYMACHQGRVIGPEAVGRKAGSSHVTWQSSNVGRIPKIIELPAQKSLLQPAHFESLKDQGVKTLVLVPLVLEEQNLGFIELHFQMVTRLTPDDLDHGQALVHHATLALQLSRLAHRTEQMAIMEERNRMAREIHDTLAQAFAGIVLHAEALGSSLEGSKARSRKSLLNIQKLARSGLEEARRSVQALRPKALDDHSLTQALEEAAKRLSEDAKLSCEFKQRGEALKMPVEMQNELFRVAQEAMTNLRKHARAKSAWINLEFKSRRVILTIRDNGVGLAATNPSKRKRGYGMATMRERALRIGGKLEIENPASGGTAIRVVVPLAENGESVNSVKANETIKN